MVHIQFPVVTNDGVDFWLNDLRCVMESGSTLYLRLSGPHCVPTGARSTGSIW